VSPPISNFEASQERRSRVFWITFILGFFALDISIAVIAIVMAAGDPSFRPMPDYGDRSVAWEVHHQERISSEKLGWSVSVSAVEPDRQTVDFIIVDRAGASVEGGSGDASGYHLTRVAEQQHSKLTEIEPGRYRASLNCQRPGLWKLDLRLNRVTDSTLTERPSAEPQGLEERFVYESTIEFPSP
jgi:nitrogen fixation protein FixH